MKKIILSILVLSLTLNLFSQKKSFLIKQVDTLQIKVEALNQKSSILNKQLKEKEAENIVLQKKIDSLKNISYVYSLKLDTTLKKYNELTVKYDKYTKTAEYFYKKGIEQYNNNEYTESYKTFSYVIQMFPNDNLAKNSSSQINLLNQKSNANYSTVLKSNTKLPIKERITYLSDIKTKYFFNQKDALKIDNLISKTSIEYEAEKYVYEKDDPLQSCKFYQTSRNVTYNDYGQSYEVSIYIVKNYKGTKYFRLRTEYSGDDWIFYKSIIIRGDNGAQINIACDYPEKKSDNGSYGVREWSDNYMNKTDQNKIISIAKSNKITVRFNGQYTKTFEMTDDQVKAFKEIALKFSKI